MMGRYNAVRFLGVGMGFGLVEAFADEVEHISVEAGGELEWEDGAGAGISMGREVWRGWGRWGR